MKAAVGAALSLGIAVLFTTACGEARKFTPPPVEAEVTDFHTLFSENCVGCHGLNGVKGPGPRLNDPLYLSIVPRDELLKVIAEGRLGTPMPAFARSSGGGLSQHQVEAIADGMVREWSRNVDVHDADVPAYSVSKAPQGDMARGQAAYMKNCMMCHGFAKFKGAAGPIADPNYLALVSDQGLRTTMIVGRPDWGMPDWRHRIPGHPTSDQDMADIAAWLGTMRPKYSVQATAATPSPGANLPSVSTSTSGQSSQASGPQTSQEKR